MDWDLVHPKARGAFQALDDELFRKYLTGEIAYWFKPFEGYRSPQRQNELLKKGTTKARAFESAHQYGLAVDFVPFIVRAIPRESLTSATTQGTWSWDIPTTEWDEFDRVVMKHDLFRPIAWDRPHVEHRLWRLMRPSMTY